MKYLEYYYNIIFYFFYMGAIKFFYGIDYIFWPILKIFYFIINKLPAIRRYYVTDEYDDPEKAAKVRLKKITENPERSLGTTIGGGITLSVLGIIYLGIWHIIRNYFFPTYQDSLVTSLIIIGFIAYTTDNLLVTQHDQGVKYIKQFNKKKGWWRIKWSIITALSPFFAIGFALMTSSYGTVGQYLLELNGYSGKAMEQLIYKSKYNRKNNHSFNIAPASNFEEQQLLNKIRKHTPDRAE